MSPIEYQSTIAQPAQVAGFGFWSGRDATLEFRPAAENSGIVFVRSDLNEQPRVPAHIYHRVQGPRRTTLVHKGCAIELVEHVLAALAGMEISNCEVWVNRPEIPGCDGSSLQFVEALQKAGRVKQGTGRPRTVINETIRVGDEQSWILAEPSVTPGLQLRYQLNYENNSIGKQDYSATITPDTFSKDIAPARTFLLENEAQELQKSGLGTRVSYQDVLVFGKSGLLSNQLRFEDECARHKLLDMIGDFALLGNRIQGKITACKSGHALNAKMVLALINQAENTKSIRVSA